ncbi:oligosaccharide flippase family protein [Enterococcus faecalis]|nr:oligosaccharide flippase family protein [Enterococcus faecalis]
MKFFGKSEYGLYQIANSIINNLTLLNLGLSFAYIRFYTGFSMKKEEVRIRKLNGTYILFFSVISVIASFIGVILIRKSNYFLSSSSVYEQEMLKKLMFFMIINVALNFMGATFESNILANERFVFQQVRQMLQSIFLPVMTAPVLLLFHTNVVTIVVIQTIITFVGLFVNFYFCVRKIRMKFSFKNLEFSFIKEVGKFSFFIFLNQLFNQINDSAPIFILGILTNTNQVAIYSIVNQLKALFLTFSQVLSTVFIPKVNRIVHQSDDSNELTQLMIKIGQYQVLLLGLFLGGFILLGKKFLYLWLGKGFNDAYYLLISIVIPLVIPLCQNIAIEIQQARNQHIFRSIMLTAFSFFNIGITAICVKMFGINGVTIGYIFSLIFGYGLVMNWYYQKKMKLDMKCFWQKMFPGMIPIILSVMIGRVFLNVFGTEKIFSFVLVGSVYFITYSFCTFLFMPHIFQQILRMFVKKEKRK